MGEEYHSETTYYGVISNVNGNEAIISMFPDKITKYSELCDKVPMKNSVFERDWLLEFGTGNLGDIVDLQFVEHAEGTKGTVTMYIIPKGDLVEDIYSPSQRQELLRIISGR
jgi:hypothetical protein